MLVDTGVVLTIEPGVAVQFASGTVLQVNGTLVARGTSDNPIVFTSNQASPAPGDWVYIFFASSSTPATFDADGNYTGGSVLEYCEVSYAGGAGSVAAVQTDSTGPLIDHCTIRDSATSGLRLYASNMRVRNSSIINNRQHGVSIKAGPLTFSNDTVSGNGERGFYIDNYAGGRTTITNSTIEDNAAEGIWVYN